MCYVAFGHQLEHDDGIDDRGVKYRAVMIKISCWSRLNNDYNKELQNSIGNCYFAPLY